MTCSGLCEPLRTFLFGNGNRLIDALRAILSVKHLGQVSHQGEKSGENRLFSQRSAAMWGKWGKTSRREALSGP